MNPEKFQSTDQNNEIIIESSHSEKREKIHDQMHERVQNVKEVRTFVDVKKDLPAEEFEEVCEEWLRELLTTMPGLSVRDLQEVEEYTPGYIELSEVKGEYEHYSAQGQQGEKWYKTDNGGVISNEEVLRVRREYILGYEAALKEFPIDKLLALEISRFISHVIKRKKEALIREELYQRDQEEFFDSTLLKGLYDENQVESIEVDFSGLNTNIILDDALYNAVEEKTGRQKNKTSGLHAVGTVINFIRRDDTQEETIQHEENHTISECFVNMVRKSEFALQTTVLIDDYEDALSNTTHTPQEKEVIIQRKKKELGDYIRWYADRNTNELIADIDSLANGNVATFFNDFQEDRQYLQVLIEQQNNEAIIAVLERNLNENDTQFVDYMSRLSNLFFAAKRTGYEEDIKAAVILFKPSQMRHIERYAKDLCGNEEYEFAERLRPLVCGGSYLRPVNGYNPRRTNRFLNEWADTQRVYESLATRDATESFFSVENTARLNKLLKEKDVSLQEEERIQIEELLAAGTDLKLDPLYILQMHASERDLTWVSTLDANLKQLGELLDIDAFGDFVDERLSSEYAQLSLYGCAQHTQTQSLKESYERWPMNQVVLRQEYLRLLEEGVVLFQTQGNEYFTMDDYLEFLSSIGYKEEEIQQAVSRADQLLDEGSDDYKKAA